MTAPIRASIDIEIMSN